MRFIFNKCEQQINPKDNLQALGGLDDLLNRLEPSVQSLLTASTSDPALMKRLNPSQGMAQGLSQLSAVLCSIMALVYEQTDTVSH